MVAGLFAGMLAGAPAASAPPAAPAAPAGPETPEIPEIPADEHGAAQQAGVVLVGVPGLAWPDVTAEDMPTLFELAGSDAAASLSVRTIRSRTCTVDGWLSVGAGRRATDLTDTIGDGIMDRFCRRPPSPVESGDGSARVPGWDELASAQQDQDYGTEIGMLGSRIAEAGACSVAVGRGAALALADSSGRVQNYLPDVSDLTTEWMTQCQVTVVDLGVLPVSSPAPEREDEPYFDERRAAAKTLDAELAKLIAILPENVALLVAGVADSAPGSVPEPDEPLQIAPSGLRVAVAAGPKPDGSAYGPNWLISRSTKWAGLVQLVDIHATLAAYAGIPDPAAGTVGGPWRVSGPHPGASAATVDQLLGMDRATRVFRTQSGPFFQLLGIGQVVFFGGALLWLRFRPRRRSAVLRLAQGVALVVAAFPVASFLANVSRWWRFERAGTVLWLIIFALTLALAMVALAGPWRRRTYGPPGVLAAITAVMLGVDVWTGGHLQHASLLGLSPVVAGRFYGFGNIAFAIFAASAVIATAALAQWLHDLGYSRRTGTVAATVIGVVTVATMGAPWAGANFGGTLSTLPGFALLVIGISGARVTIPRIAVAGLAGVVLVLLIAWLDWLRPAASRTHFGSFFADLLDGQAWTVATRKARASLGTLQRSPYYGWLVPIAYVVITWLVRGDGVGGMRDLYDRWPILRYGIWAGLLTGAVGFATNDSGIIIPALLLTTAIPLVVSAVAHACRIAGEPPGPPTRAVRAATAGPDAPANASRSR
jgi:hypothetical protein